MNNQRISEPFQDKKEIQINLKNKTRITKKKNTFKKTQVNNNVNNNIEQQQGIQRLPKRGLTNPALLGKKPQYAERNNERSRRIR